MCLVQIIFDSVNYFIIIHTERPLDYDYVMPKCSGDMDEVVVQVEKTKREWDDAYEKTIEHIIAIQEYGKSRREGEEKISLQRLNGLAQDGLSLLNSLQFNLDLLAPQLPSDDQVQSTQSLLETWKNQYQRYVLSL